MGKPRTILETCEHLHMYLSGSADGLDQSEIQEMYDFLVQRSKNWREDSTNAFYDLAVKNLLLVTIAEAIAYIAEHTMLPGIR